MRVRWARDDDGPELARIARAAWSRDSSVLPRPEAGQDVFRSPVTPEHVLVALDGEEPVGYIKLVPTAVIRPLLAEVAGHVDQVYGLSVTPAHQGRGAGTALLRAAQEDALARSSRRITMRVLSSNARAQRLYERLGYRVEGVLREEFLVDGTYVDDVLLALDLT